MAGPSALVALTARRARPLQAARRGWAAGLAPRRREEKIISCL